MVMDGNGDLDLSKIKDMDFQALVAQLASKITDDELEKLSAEDLKTSVGPIRVPVVAYATIKEHADEEKLSVSNFVIKTINDTLSLNIPYSEGKGRKKAEYSSEDEKKAALKLKNAQKAAQVDRMLRELGAR